MLVREKPSNPPPQTRGYDPFNYRRRRTREVMVGHIGVGGMNPIRIQSMTTTPTDDTEKTVAQVLRLAEVGCEIARITAPTVLDAKNLEYIKAELLHRGCKIPLVADIHFRPDAAMVAADFVEKVRINPGNFVDGKAFKVREYSDEEYLSELHRIEDKFTPLVLKLKKLGRALRVGTNHGSLSDRIMNRFGDTPLGMVESALEYLRLCVKNDYHDVIISMKASNPRVMIAAYRLLAQRMVLEGMDHPFHLGVTEAGDGEDGRIKSAAGIGSLLEDGIGDTIRVSLTEEPELEIPVARALADRYNRFQALPPAAVRSSDAYAVMGAEAPARRDVAEFLLGPILLGSKHPLRLVSQWPLSAGSAADFMALLEERLKKDTPPEIVLIPVDQTFASELYAAFREELLKETQRVALVLDLTAKARVDLFAIAADGFRFALLQENDLPTFERVVDRAAQLRVPVIAAAATVTQLLKMVDATLRRGVPVAVELLADGVASVHGVRSLTAQLTERQLQVPIILGVVERSAGLATAAIHGSLICDGMGDAVHVTPAPLAPASLDFSYNLLQACGSRITKTEYVSCPSCGRTLFDLQSTTERIKSKTSHLKGVKIAIMGCIVNGPGEMADADFGYVGGGPGKINLYVGKNCVQKSIPSEIADQKLIDLIKSNGRWVDPA